MRSCVAIWSRQFEHAFCVPCHRSITRHEQPHPSADSMGFQHNNQTHGHVCRQALSALAFLAVIEVTWHGSHRASRLLPQPAQQIGGTLLKPAKLCLSCARWAAWLSFAYLSLREVQTRCKAHRDNVAAAQQPLALPAPAAEGTASATGTPQRSQRQESAAGQATPAAASAMASPAVLAPHSHTAQHSPDRASPYGASAVPHATSNHPDAVPALRDFRVSDVWAAMRGLVGAQR